MGIDVSRLGPAAQRQILQKLQKGEAGKASAPSKMKNQKEKRVMPNGRVLTFDSKKEARRYDELVLLLAAGKIRNLRLQQTFTLQEAYTSSEGERVRSITYLADFVYEKLHFWQEIVSSGEYQEFSKWVRVVEDAKGFLTDKYKMKRKMMQDRLGITIQEV